MNGLSGLIPCDNPFFPTAADQCRARRILHSHYNTLRTSIATIEHKQTHALLLTIDQAAGTPGLTTKIVPLDCATTESAFATPRPHLSPGVGRGDTLGAGDRIAATPAVRE